MSDQPEAPSAGGTSQVGRSKRGDVVSKTSRNYGSKAGSAQAQRMEAATTGLPSTVEDIQSELVAETSSQAEARRPEGADNTEQNRQLAIDAFERQQAPVQPNQGNQPSGPAGVLDIAEELSYSNVSIESLLTFSFAKRHLVMVSVFFLVLSLLFMDIYRGPLLGARFDLLKLRSSPANSSLPASGDLHILSNRVNALEEALRRVSSTPLEEARVNWFSPMHQTLINPYYTSPTKVVYHIHGTQIYTTRKPSSLIAWIKGFKYTKITSGSPASVLGPWDEAAGPSWCAPNGDAKLQLAVALSGRVIPQELRVEHVPRGEEIAPNSAPAPKEIELWMEVEDDSTRQSIGQAFEDTYGNLEWEADTGSVRALPKTYVPIGRWTYDYHSPNNIQSFLVQIDLQGAATENVAVRVNKNWANFSSTCLYRLRMYGESRMPNFVPRNKD